LVIVCKLIAPTLQGFGLNNKPGSRKRRVGKLKTKKNTMKKVVTAVIALIVVALSVTACSSNGSNESTPPSNSSLATLTTTAATDITTTTAKVGGNITADGGGAITARGICWGTSDTPTISGSHTTETGTTGNFVSSLSGLTLDTNYFARAYATNAAGTAYGNVIQFLTLGGTINPVGVYKLTAFTTSVPTDLNGDGIKSSNQMLETICFNDSFININSDLTFSKSKKGVNIHTYNGVSTLTCYNNPIDSGTWSFSQNNTALRFETTGSTNPAVETSGITHTTIKFFIANGQVVATNATLAPVYILSNMELTYTKQ
jgi:hypothetical protein